MRRGAEPFVYFVRRADGEGPIKIGCSQTPAARLSNLMVWSPYPLAILATTPGDERLEWRLHARFRDQHSHREWFHPSPELLDLVAQVDSGNFDPSDLPEPVRLYGIKRQPWSEAQKLNARLGRAIDRARDAGIEVPAWVQKARFEIGSGNMAAIRAWINSDPALAPKHPARKAA